MSLTVADVLALPGLASMQLRAGQVGRDNAVRWSYVAENEGISDWVMGGELIFVTGINHPRGEANLLSLVEDGDAVGIAGMVILTGGTFIHGIPPVVIERAEQLGLPLIEQPLMLRPRRPTPWVGGLVEVDMIFRDGPYIIDHAGQLQQHRGKGEEGVQSLWSCNCAATALQPDRVNEQQQRQRQ